MGTQNSLPYKMCKCQSFAISPTKILIIGGSKVPYVYLYNSIDNSYKYICSFPSEIDKIERLFGHTVVNITNYKREIQENNPLLSINTTSSSIPLNTNVNNNKQTLITKTNHFLIFGSRNNIPFFCY